MLFPGNKEACCVLYLFPIVFLALLLLCLSYLVFCIRSSPLHPVVVPVPVSMSHCSPHMLSMLFSGLYLACCGCRYCQGCQSLGLFKLKKKKKKTPFVRRLTADSCTPDRLSQTPQSQGFCRASWSEATATVPTRVFTTVAIESSMQV